MSIVIVLVVAALGLMGCQSVGLTSEETDDTEAAPAMPERAFFVQVGMADARSDAEAVWQEAAAWWEEVDTRPEPLHRYDDPPVRVVWQTPYYRVRVGPMATRDDAKAVQEALKHRFDDAFIARGTP
ncbi:MAG: SPOR domain-containing protein [Longimonas sp.]|uniref:SPOR domain-containing protein n=1 Tax=Longimonas sp. TaxID=2039626 RepID=UPI003975ADB5